MAAAKMRAKKRGRKLHSIILTEDLHNRSMEVGLTKSALSAENDSFVAVVRLRKNSFCAKCLQPMRFMRTRYIQVGGGGISGIDYNIYQCTECDHVHEEMGKSYD